MVNKLLLGKSSLYVCYYFQFTAQYVKHFHFLQICMNHILAVLRIPAERASGFIALGEMAGALDGELVFYLPTIMAPLRDAVCHIQLSLTSSVP